MKHIKAEFEEIMDATEVVLHASRVAYQNRWMRVREDQFECPDGRRGIYGVVEKIDFAVIVPIADGDCMHLVEQYRYATRARSVELPQGSLETRPDTSAEEIAIQELAEETGLRAQTMEFVGSFHVAPGYSSQRSNIYIASNLKQGSQALEPEEADLRVRLHTFREVGEMIRHGLITDATTVTALFLAAAQIPSLSRELFELGH